MFQSAAIFIYTYDWLQSSIKLSLTPSSDRYDISLFPRERKYPGIIMELKWQREIDENQLDVLADKALSQINSSRYDTELKEDGVDSIIMFGIAFSGKEVKVKTNRI